MSIYVFECTNGEKEYLATHIPQKDMRAIAVPLLDREQAQAIAADADILSVFVHSALTEELLDALPNLQLIVTRSAGYDHIDLAATTKRGITVCNVPDYGESTVAEHAFALLLSLSRNIVDATQSVKNGQFENQLFQGFDLVGKTVGVIGAGRIGGRFLRMAHGFGMSLLAHDEFVNPKLLEIGVTYVSLPELLAQSDVVSLHAKSCPENYHLLNADTLALCKKGAVLINTSRGDLIDTAALLTAVQNMTLSRVGLDVVEQETALQEGMGNDALLQLINHTNVLVTPHIAYNTREAVRRILDSTLNNIAQYRVGTPQNICRAD